MKFSELIILSVLLCPALEARAQISAGGVSAMPEQWQLTLDVIKSKAQRLMVENDGLQVEYRKTVTQAKELQQAIAAEQSHNEELARKLEDHHGKTDQEVMIARLLESIKLKKQHAHRADQELENLNNKQERLESKIGQLKKAVETFESRQLNQKKAVVPVMAKPVDNPEDLDQWRKQLEQETRQEALLEAQLADLKSGKKIQDVDFNTISQQNKELEDRLSVLRLEKVHQIKKAQSAVLQRDNARKYVELKALKEQLLSGIDIYEARLRDLRETSLVTLSWPAKKKKLVHNLVLVDKKNNQIKEKIKDVQEDIDLLKDQVARLERRLNFARGK